MTMIRNMTFRYGQRAFWASQTCQVADDGRYIRANAISGTLSSSQWRQDHATTPAPGTGSSRRPQRGITWDSFQKPVYSRAPPRSMSFTIPNETRCSGRCGYGTNKRACVLLLQHDLCTTPLWLLPWSFPYHRLETVSKGHSTTCTAKVTFCSQENICIVWGRAGLNRIMAVLEIPKSATLHPEYTAYEQALGLFEDRATECPGPSRYQEKP
jgi:hypothetical protein